MALTKLSKSMKITTQGIKELIDRIEKDSKELQMLYSQPDPPGSGG